MSGNRRDRSRSPGHRSSNSSRRRDNKSQENRNMGVMDNNMPSNNMPSNNMMNQQMMMANMYAQGNMLMGGMYPNMMMPNAMMGGGMMPTTGLDMMPQASMDMTSIGGQSMPSNTAPSMDMTMMGGMMMDTSVMGNMGMYPNVNGEINTVFENNKELILKRCKLTPPEPGAQSPPRRPKPLGCRTIFVAGFPDNVGDSIVKEIFEHFGKIHTLRLSTKNFCHIRFEKESSVDAAMAISGYHIRLLGRNNDEEDTKTNSGWLHVDYALSRDDQNEYERIQRQALRVQEVQMQQLNAQQQALASRSMSSYRRSPSPLRAQPFSNASMVQLSEKIKSEDHFAGSIPTLLSWLERGECSKKNATQFYSMIQATNSHIRRLFGEKMQAEEEYQECKERIKNNINNIIEQLEQVAKVFTAATHQRVWDHFTKPQRKNIETWQKMSQEFSILKEEFNEKFCNEDNDNYGGCNNTPRAIDMGGGNEEVQKLKLENDSLKFQLEAYKNEVDVIKADAQKEMEKFKAQFIARQALQGAFDNKNLPPLPSPVAKPPPPPPLPDDVEMKVNIQEVVDVGCGEAKLIGIMSAFLQVHPQGASLDYVVSYVRALFPRVSQAAVHRVLQKHEDVFQCTTTGVGANIEHRWSFIAYDKPINPLPLR